MTYQPRISAKATSQETRSDSIVVSFDNFWYDRIRSRSFSAVIRKRVPTSFRPSWIYFHVNSPRSAICARASLTAIGSLTLDAALKIADALALSTELITSYVADAKATGVYWLGEIELAKIEVAASTLANRMSYNPPQSFFVLSKEAKRIVDEMCGFVAHG